MLQMKPIFIVATTLFGLTLMGDPPKNAYEKISRASHEASQGELAARAQGYDLRSSENSNVLLSKLQERVDRDPGEFAGHHVLGLLIKAQPENVIEWVMDHYEKLEPRGLSSLAAAVSEFDFREAYVLNGYMLNDRSVVSFKSHREPPPPPYWDLRVCDCAYNSMASRFKKSGGWPAGLELRIWPSDPIDKRDSEIERLKAWWSKESIVFLQQKRPLSEKRPAIGTKIQALHDRITKPSA